MAVGIIIGAAFSSVVSSLVDDILMPPLGWLTGGADFESLFVVLEPGTEPPPYASLNAAEEVGAVTWNYGAFINTTVEFLIVAFAVFMLVRSVNRLREEPEAEEAPKTRSCPYCTENIDLMASRCPHCTSEVEPA